MARISAKRTRDGYRVTVAGRLSAIDLRRLERACGPALERHNAALAIDLSGVTDTDASADAFLGRLLERGARLHRDAVHHAPNPEPFEGRHPSGD